MLRPVTPVYEAKRTRREDGTKESPKRRMRRRKRFSHHGGVIYYHRRERKYPIISTVELLIIHGYPYVVVPLNDRKGRKVPQKYLGDLSRFLEKEQVGNVLNEKLKGYQHYLQPPLT
jgi:hypothetical protein